MNIILELWLSSFYHWLLKRNMNILSNIISNLHKRTRAWGPNTPQTMKPHPNNNPFSTLYILLVQTLCCQVVYYVFSFFALHPKWVHLTPRRVSHKQNIILHKKEPLRMQIMTINDIKTVIIHLSWSLDLVFASTSLYTIMPVPPILMAPRGPSSPTLISCSLCKKWRRAFRTKLS